MLTRFAGEFEIEKSSQKSSFFGCGFNFANSGKTDWNLYIVAEGFGIDAGWNRRI